MQRQQNCTSHTTSAICSLWKFSSAYLNKTACKIMFLPINNLQEKSISDCPVGWKFDNAHAIFTLHSCYLKKNIPVFSQWDARNFM